MSSVESNEVNSVKSSLISDKIVFIGGGNMSRAIVSGLHSKQNEILFDFTDQISICDRNTSKLNAFRTQFGIQNTANTIPDLISNIFQSDPSSDSNSSSTKLVFILSIKPYALSDAIESLISSLNHVFKDNQVKSSREIFFISVCAGISLNSINTLIQSSLSNNVLSKPPPFTYTICRVMPNTAAQIGKSASAYSFLSNSNKNPLNERIVQVLFGSVGNVYEVKESLLDAVTGVSGSGPAYVYLFIEALSDAGVLHGLSRDVSLSLAVDTVLGAALMLKENGNLHPAQLRNQVESPGGTTIAATSALESNGFRNSVSNAVSAAVSRSKQISQEK
eukprot:CAMPEP_0182442774 /NCGR_PEP_ID=MMETSP1172-20130603/1650_1 /TAXON_ID=708627 /ORGANISM="Timspurckia oligopyrenoides, Strain CCMP3278" /LENGTH=333 /DNA_ID=CAMNT_0024637797 /DNA_START=309 /DNA_END=1310 /DNA_ORIENTATION=+